jgi:hypothetical protein
MGTILRKWKWLIVVGLALVFFAYVADPVGSFVVKTFLRFRSSQDQSSLTPRWRTFTNRECGYVVEFPSHPFENPYELSNRQAVVSYRQFVSVLATNNCFMVATLVTSLTNDFTEEQINLLLDKSVMGPVGPKDKLLAKRDIKLEASIGKEIEFQREDKFYFKMRCYQVGRKLQQLTIVEPLADQHSTNIDRFLDSFHVISE